MMTGDALADLTDLMEEAVARRQSLLLVLHDGTRLSGIPRELTGSPDGARVVLRTGETFALAQLRSARRTTMASGRCG